MDAGNGGTADPERHGLQVGTVADQMLAPITVIAPDSTLLYVNAAAARSIGQEPSWLIGRKMLQLVHPEDRARIRRELRQVASGRPSAGLTRYRIRANSTQAWRVFESIADNLLDTSEVGGILVSSHDITQQLEREHELSVAAYRDPLTGLPNRARLAQELDRLLAGHDPVAIAFFGIDRFGFINDSLGHSTGDTVLEAVAARVEASVPARTMVARFGDARFGVLASGEAAADARYLLWRVVERVGEPLFVDGHELQLSSSAGIAQRGATATRESLLSDASLALHQAWTEGGGRVVMFETEMRDAAIARLELEANLRQAITRSELSLALQPIVRLSDSVPVRAEALVRWHRAGGSVEPERLIPVAEETGLIVPLGDWIIDKAAQLAPGAPGGQVMVNLSPRQLASPGLTNRIARVLAARHLPADSLGFEITETLLIENFDYAVNVLAGIRQLGCRIGLDDFGTGYSSLGYLRRLPIDFLKIDTSLCTDVDSDPSARAIVGAIITMADALGLETVAEGVETERQAATLRDLGCTLAQGYLFGRPADVT
jgi:diguanylate cyclase (GGDEF)-like protein/PAS domain S-box-containing protein